MTDPSAFNPPDKPGGPSVEKVPDGDNRKRLVCPDCGYIAYQNPKIIAGALCLFGDQVLLCRRDIEPRRGFWTFPAGYLELNESTAEGTVREAREEANVEIEIDGLIGIFELPHISQLYVIHRAIMTSPDYSVGEETAEVALFHWDDIPWDELAFSSVKWALERYKADAPPGVGHSGPVF